MMRAWSRIRGAGSAGRYSIDEYTITLSLDGKSTQALFYFYPDSDDAIGIGGGPGSARTAIAAPVVALGIHQHRLARQNIFNSLLSGARIETAVLPKPADG